MAKSCGGARVSPPSVRFVPPRLARLFAGFGAVLGREGVPRGFEGLQAEPIAPVPPPNRQLASGSGVARAAASIVKITGVACGISFSR